MMVSGRAAYRYVRSKKGMTARRRGAGAGVPGPRTDPVNAGPEAASPSGRLRRERRAPVILALRRVAEHRIEIALARVARFAAVAHGEAALRLVAQHGDEVGALAGL